MATTITSVQAGDWNTAATWDSGTVPTSGDDVVINHDVTIAANISARYVTIETGGSLHVDDGYNWLSEITVDVQLIRLRRVLHDTRKVNLDGCTFSAYVQPAISCLNNGADGFPVTPDLNNTNIIIDDPGFISSSARLRDILPEGCAPAYAEKISNAVRYMTATVHIKVGYLRYLASLYRMAAGPFQVLLVTSSCLIKGFIENVTPDPQSIGKEYITVRVTVAEGPGA